MKNRGFFITGTNTNVGKTIISIWLCKKLEFTYFKPVETGESDFAMASTFVNTHKPIYSLKKPISPHLSALNENIKISLSDIVIPSGEIIIEGAGGIFVPLNDEEFILDLIKKSHLSVILVAKDQLGIINDTLLSIFALQRHNIDVVAIILNKTDPNDNLLGNAEQIEKFTKIKVFQFPFLQQSRDLDSVEIPELINILSTHLPR